MECRGAFHPRVGWCVRGEREGELAGVAAGAAWDGCEALLEHQTEAHLAGQALRARTRTTLPWSFGARRSARATKGESGAAAFHPARPPLADSVR